MAFIQPKTFIIVAAVKIIVPPPRIFFSLEKHTLNKWHYVYDYSIAKEVYKVLMLMKDTLNAIFIVRKNLKAKQTWVLKIRLSLAIFKLKWTLWQLFFWIYKKPWYGEEIVVIFLFYLMLNSEIFFQSLLNIGLAPWQFFLHTHQGFINSELCLRSRDPNFDMGNPHFLW